MTDLGGDEVPGEVLGDVAEGRERMARTIHQWKPWEQSAGPRTAAMWRLM